MSRNTVRRILEQHATARAAVHESLSPPPARLPRSSKLDDHRARVAELLERYPDITAQRVFEELRAAGFSGGYTAVKQHVRKTRPVRKPEPSLVTPVYGPGKMAESDWSPHAIAFTAAARAVVQVFAYVLCHSRRKSYRLHERCDLHALMDGHVATFERFQGAAEECKYDSQKPVVLYWEGSQPIYNPRFLAFATHYEFRPRACRRGHPNDKPHVERAFWEFERSFLNGRSFRDLDDMRAQLATWARDTCDRRPHHKLKRTSLAMFEEEREHLVPLPAHPYDTARVLYRLCSIDGFINWDGNRYAVPYDHVTDILPVRVTERSLFVYAADLKRIAQHELAPRSAGVDVDPQGFHHPCASRRPAADLAQLQKTFNEMGEDGADFFSALLTASPRQCGHQAREILMLRERFSTDDLCAALRHARLFGALSYQAVARIVAARSAPRTLAEYVTEQTTRRLEERLGTTAAPPRDLSEYDQLPLSTAPNEQETAP